MTLRNLLATLLMAPSALTLAQNADTTAVVPQQPRPKIGLVLSGGGAKGLAHVGILKAIDRAGLNIDYITGTSMGAIIAAMYAAGYNGEQIEQIARSMNWTDAMSGSARYSDISIEAKDEFENYAIEVPVEGFHIKPSTGIIDPQEVMLKFSEVFFPVYKTKDFSQLNIPFKCVATDLSNGEAVVLDKGDIAYAVRSSMAIPGVFAATDYKNTKLVDGGIVRNFPVKDVLEMGADYVIGVNLFDGLTSPDNMSSMIDVMMQITNFRDANDLIHEKRVCDMVIEPNVSKFSAASFGSADEIMAIGDSTGNDFYPLFKQLADNMHNAYGTPYANTNRLAPYEPKVKIKSFIFNGLHNTDEALLMHNLNLRAGRSYTPSQLNEAFRRAYSSLYYTKLNYELLPVDDENGVCLKCNVDEQPLSTVKIGLSYNTFTNASLILGYSLKNILGQRSVTDLKMSISQSFRFKAANRVFFGAKYNHFIDAKYEFSKFDIPFYAHRSSQKEYVYSYMHNELSASMGHIFSPISDMNVKLGYESFKISPDVLGSQPAAMKGTIRNIFVSATKRYNTLDRKYLPQSGVLFNSEIYCAFKPSYNISPIAATGTEAEEHMQDLNKRSTTVYRLLCKAAFHQPLTQRATLIENVALTASYGDKAFVHNTFLGGVNNILPSHVPFYGLTAAHKPESSFIMGGIGLQYRLVGELYTTFRYNTAVTFYSIDQYTRADNPLPFEVKEYIHGIGATVAYNFSHLPFDLTLMYSPDYKFNVSVNVGFLF